MTSSSATAASSRRRPSRSIRRRMPVYEEASSASSDACSSAGSADESADGGGSEIPLIEQLLPGHKIARGRGRRKQLEQMTEEEKEAEKESRMEKMRISARECRKRKKKNIAGLEQKLRQFEQKDKRNTTTIRQLRDDMRALRENLAAIKTGRSASSLPRPSNFHQSDHHMVPQQQQPQQQPNLYYHEGGIKEEHELYEHAQAGPAVTAMVAEEAPRRYDTIGEEGPYETLSSVSVARPALSFEKRSGFAPAVLDFAKLSSSEEAGYRLPTPETPLTPHLRLEMDRYRMHTLKLQAPFTPQLKLDDLMPGFALPTPEAGAAEVPGGMHFAFDEVETVLLG